jgi:uncharacterized protein YdhG (YjbR/CyaY superfamily)
MQYFVENVEAYINSLPEDRIEPIQNLRKIINENLPVGFQECISYGMIGYMVPFETYPHGYHCDNKLPLPFLNIASQKNFISVYHMGIYADPKIMDWFVSEFPKHSSKKLDIGKSCIRFKNVNDIPYELLGQLFKKMTVENWVNLYESLYKK